MSDFKFHPAAREFPLLDDERIDQLANDIRNNGLREPICICDGKIVDGRNRYIACRKVGVEPRIVDLPQDVNPFAYVWSLNGERRDLTQDQRYLIWKSCAEKSGVWEDERRRLEEEANKSRSESQKDVSKSGDGERPSTNCGRSHAPRGKGSSIRAAISKTNRGAVERMDRLQREHPDLADKVRLGLIRSSDAMREIQSPHVAHNTGDSEWFTPQEYIQSARVVMGHIDLDPASCKAANSVVGAKRYFTADEDGLAQPWQGRVWMNPPYAQPLVRHFCEKLTHEFTQGNVMQAMVLANNATETEWFQNLAAHASALFFPKGRIRFWHPDKESAPLQGQVVIYLGNHIASFCQEFSRKKGFVCRLISMEESNGL